MDLYDTAEPEGLDSTPPQHPGGIHQDMVQASHSTTVPYPYTSQPPAEPAARRRPSSGYFRRGGVTAPQPPRHSAVPFAPNPLQAAYYPYHSPSNHASVARQHVGPRMHPNRMPYVQPLNGLQAHHHFAQPPPRLLMHTVQPTYHHHSLPAAHATNMGPYTEEQMYNHPLATVQPHDNHMLQLPHPQTLPLPASCGDNLDLAQHVHPAPHTANAYLDPALQELDSNIEAMSNATKFVEDFSMRFASNAAALALFEHLCKLFNSHIINPIAFYKGVYKILFRGGALDMLPSFMAFLPKQWTVADLEPHNREAQLEISRESPPSNWPAAVFEELHRMDENSVGELLHPSSNLRNGIPMLDTEEKGDRPAAEKTNEQPPNDPEPPSKERKKRPINAFTTDQFTNVEKGRINNFANRVVAGPDKIPALSTRDHVNPFAASSSTPINGVLSLKRRRESETETLSTLTKLPVILPAKFAKTTAATTLATNDANEAKPGASTSEKTIASSTKKKKSAPAATRVNYTTVPASSIPHFGPVFKTRRQILARASKPYTHHQCGNRFPHPDDVHGHHRRACHGNKHPNKGSQAWDKHPSCQIKYASLKVVKCMDGFVVTDKEAWEKLQECIKVGLQNDGKKEAEGDGEVMDGVECEVDKGANDGAAPVAVGAPIPDPVAVKHGVEENPGSEQEDENDADFGGE